MSIAQIVNVIRKYRSFIISTHVNPDPDALASELAMGMFLKALGKKVQIVNAESRPARFKFLPGSGMIKAFQKGRRYSAECIIVVDCGDLNRIGTVKKIIQPDHVVINIDHHVTNDRFGRYNLVRPQSSSTAEVIYDILKQARFPLTKNIAMLLYLGIMTDTGSFRYDNTSARTHVIAGDLMKFKFPVNTLFQKLYESIPLEDVRSFSKVVNDFEVFHRGRVICLELPQRWVKKFSAEFDLRDKIFKYLRAIQGVEVVCILTEMSPQETRVNLRSQGKVNVASLASQFNGGGHQRASGCHMEKGMKETKRNILNHIRKVL